MNAYPLTLFHDGACPVCRADIALMRARDSRRLLRFVDITDPGFDPAAHGLQLADFQARMHALRADGRMVEGVEVFRLAYRAIGLGRWIAPLTDGRLRPLAEAGYRLFARHRHRLGWLLGPLLDAFAARQARRVARCHGGQCDINRPTH